MLFIKYFKALIGLIFLLSQTVYAADLIEKNCGGTVFLIKTSGTNISELDYKLYYKINGNEKKLFYIPQVEYLSVACVQSKEKRSFLLMEERCGGSACSDEGIYTIFDPRTKEFLVKYVPFSVPNNDESLSKMDIQVKLYEYEQKNHQQIERILGYAPPYLPDNKKSFCCMISN